MSTTQETKRFIARMASGTAWKAIAASAKQTVEEATFTADSSGLTFRAMDPSHVQLVNVILPREGFELYQCEKGFKFTVRMEDFVKLIARSEAKDAIELGSGDDGDLELSMIPDSKEKTGYRRNYRVHLIESAPGDAPLPKLDFSTKIALGKVTFEKVMGDISVVAETVQIDALKAAESVVFSGRSDVGQATIQLDKGGIDILDLTSSDDASAAYNIDYLNTFSKAIGAATDIVVLEYSSKKPVRLEYKLNDQGGVIQMFLAPRINER